MHIRTLYSLSLAFFLVTLVAALPAFARATANDPIADKAANSADAARAERTAVPVPQPRQDQSKKVYTNDDFGWFNPSSSAAATSQPAQAAVTSSQASNVSYGAQPTPLDPEKDPDWYARQVTLLESDLAVVQSQQDALQQFRATSEGLPTGLVLNAPTEGITTDNLIAQLESRSQQIEQQLDDLADLARVNGLPPGTVNQPSVPTQPTPTIAQQQDALTTDYRDVSDQLAETQSVLDDMQQQAAAQGITLLPSDPANGGNLTTNLLNNLDSQADVLQTALSDAEDNARSLGVQPGDLR